MFVNIVSRCICFLLTEFSVILLMFMMQNFDDDNTLTKLTYM